MGESSEWGRAASRCEQPTAASSQRLRAASGCEQREVASAYRREQLGRQSKACRSKRIRRRERIGSVRKESAPNDETSLSQALQCRLVARYRNRRLPIDRSDQLTGRSLVKVQVSSLKRLPPQIAALAAPSIIAVNSQQTEGRVVCPSRRQI